MRTYPCYFAEQILGEGGRRRNCMIQVDYTAVQSCVHSNVWPKSDTPAHQKVPNFANVPLDFPTLKPACPLTQICAALTACAGCHRAGGRAGAAGGAGGGGERQHGGDPPRRAHGHHQPLQRHGQLPRGGARPRRLSPCGRTARRRRAAASGGGRSGDCRDPLPKLPVHPTPSRSLWRS